LKARLYGLLPRIRIADLLAEVSAWTGFADHFVHARTGMAASDQPALMGAIFADGTNHGLARMAESSRGLPHTWLLWTPEWHATRPMPARSPRSSIITTPIRSAVDEVQETLRRRTDSSFVQAGAAKRAPTTTPAMAASRACCSTRMSPTHEHATDTAGAVDHVFGLCHLLGFRWARTTLLFQ